MEINWTSSANASFEDEIEFILSKWNLKEVEKFINLVDGFTKKLSDNPYIGKKSVKEDVRVFVLSKQTTVIYEVFEDLNRKDLQFFWNNKKKPKELKKYLK